MHSSAMPSFQTEDPLHPISSLDDVNLLDWDAIGSYLSSINSSSSSSLRIEPSPPELSDHRLPPDLLPAAQFQFSHDRYESSATQSKQRDQFQESFSATSGIEGGGGGSRSPWLDKQVRMAPRSLDLNGWLSVLHIAAQEGHEHIVRMLLQHGVDCNEHDSDGLTPLMHATIQDHLDVINLLLVHGARIGEVDRENRTALHWAVLHRRGGILRVLLEHNSPARGPATSQVDINAYDAAGWTPLHMAVERGFEVGVGILLQHGANMNFKARKCPFSGKVTV
ncbi:Ankyrin repeat domain-containing protein [Paramyrothecium foliicola]|nr:Ankyrin repeat domain-containing protein [Paramyrothecium foliicola]